MRNFIFSPERTIPFAGVAVAECQTESISHSHKTDTRFSFSCWYASHTGRGGGGWKLPNFPAASLLSYKLGSASSYTINGCLVWRHVSGYLRCQALFALTKEQSSSSSSSCQHIPFTVARRTYVIGANNCVWGACIDMPQTAANKFTRLQMSFSFQCVPSRKFVHKC